MLSPLTPISVEKVILPAGKLHLQRNFNWPEKLHKYFAQKNFFYKAIYFSG